MSFYSNFQSDKCPGTITGNPLNGLTEKVCIQAEKIFDACIKQTQLENYTLVLTDFVPENPTYPLTFISARSTTARGTISNLLIDPIADKPNSARVRADVTIPVTVAYTDANGVEGVATSSFTVTKDVILCVPAPSVMPYEVEAVVSMVSAEGTYTGAGQFTINGCSTVILKIVMEVELLVPSYGYCAIPPCQEYSQEVCAGFFELPLYPGGDSDCPGRGN